MHYMLRVTRYGIAMHLGHVPNYPASHGCIRMQNGFAQRMYRWARVGIPISIVGSPPWRVSRFGSSSSYRTHNQAHSPNDFLAKFMGLHSTKRTTRRSSRSRTHSSRKRSKHSSRRRQHHGSPLNAVSAR
jgi:hypothetical protein